MRIDFTMLYVWNMTYMDSQGMRLYIYIHIVIYKCVLCVFAVHHADNK